MYSMSVDDAGDDGGITMYSTPRYYAYQKQISTIPLLEALVKSLRTIAKSLSTGLPRTDKLNVSSAVISMRK
jgi:hypothetical protein